ncbi:unnamed protein product [Cylindrotheca closterium]|uniref:Uncharacterized protein n=1 Tax=Cylindrotheca closterium TaxID=2856 RepID=A0AAD2CIC1_9STRA|nr:unnamed protein product [Cylindrotheca closterium]
MARKSSQDQSSAGIIVETLMKEARERVACDFLEACEGDEAKRAVVLELCKKVLSNEQYSKIVSAKRSEEDDSEIDEQDDNGNDESDGSGERDEGSSDDSSIPTMKDIKGKPYQDGISAETGELPFEEFEDLFEPDGNQQENQKEQMCRRKPSLIPNKDAIRLFGAEAAKKLVNWHHHVKHSGQLYSEEWLEGRIRDQNLGTIAKPMLLICLQHIKISRAPTAVLGKICHDLELQSLIKKALEVWGVADRFPRLWARKPADQYARTGDIKMCRQCEIFVARAYVCVTTLKHAAVSDDLGNKLLSCLVDMEKNLPPDLAKKRARRMSKDSPRRNGKVLGEFNSARDIVNRLGDSMNVDYICKVLKGKQKTACNYIWRYKKVSTSTNTISKARGKPKTKERPEDGRNGGREDEEMDSQVASLNKRLGKSISPTRKEKAGSLTDIAKTKSVTRNTSNEDTSDDTDDECNIEQLSLETGEVLGEFSNVLEIEDRIGHLLNVTSPRSSIFTVLRGVQKSACGFGWRYKKKSTTARNISSQTVSSKETKGGNRADSNKGDTQAASPNMGLDSSMSPKMKEKVASSTDNAKNNLAATNTSNADACDDTDDEGIIEQVSLETGEVLGEFSNVLEVEDRIGHLLNTTNPRKRIKMVLRGVQKSAAGFSWRYKKKLTSAGNKSNQTNKSKETKGDNLAEGSEGEKGYIRAVSPYKRLDKTEPTQQPMKKSSSTLKEVTKKTSPLSKSMFADTAGWLS